MWHITSFHNSNLCLHHPWMPQIRANVSLCYVTILANGLPDPLKYNVMECCHLIWKCSLALWSPTSLHPQMIDSVTTSFNVRNMHGIPNIFWLIFNSTETIIFSLECCTGSTDSFIHLIISTHLHSNITIVKKLN